MSIFSGKTHLRTNVVNQAITGNTAILSANVTPKYVPLSFFLVYCCFDDIGILTVRRTFTDIGITRSELMNEGNNLVQSAAYVFAFPVSENEEINFQFSSSTTLIKLMLIESEVK